MKFVQKAAWGTAVCLSLACSKLHDPTAIMAPAQTGPVVGVQFKLGRQGDGVSAVTHVWVEDNAGNNILTLSTTTGLATLSVLDQTKPSTFCNDISPYWPSYCAANPTNLTDANTHATVIYSTDTLLYYSWDWKNRTGIVVPNGIYHLKAELAGYPYSDVPAEASVTVLKNGAAGASNGTATGAWQSASATWNP